MNKYKSKFEESEEFNGRKIDGVVFSVNTIKQLLDEGLEDFMIENFPGGGFNALDIQEMHI